MSLSFFAVIAYIVWTIILIIMIEVFRTYLVVKTGHAINDFSPDGSDISPFAHRLSRAHANCYESFPIIGGTLLVALATGQTGITDPLALWVIAARVAQSSTYMISGSVPASQVRFLFFLIQLTISTWWIVQLLLQFT